MAITTCVLSENITLLQNFEFGFFWLYTTKHVCHSVGVRYIVIAFRIFLFLCPAKTALNCFCGVTLLKVLVKSAKDYLRCFFKQSKKFPISPVVDLGLPPIFKFSIFSVNSNFMQILSSVDRLLPKIPVMFAFVY